MNPKRNKLKSITFANLLVFWCMTVGTGYAQETIDEVTNDSDVVQEAINEAFGLEQKKAEVVAKADEKTEEVVTKTEEVEPAAEAVVEAVVVPVEPAKPLTELEKSEVVRRRASKISGYNAFEAATKAEADGEYQKAISLYEKSINELETVSKNDKLVLAKINDAEVAQGRVNALWADELAAEADEKVSLSLYTDAISKLTTAQSKNPAKTKEYQARIDELKEMEDKATYIAEIKVNNVDPNKEDRDKQVKTLLEQGKVHLRNNRIAEAIYSFDGVRRIEPLNKQAYKYLTQAQAKLEEFAKEYKKLSRDRYSNMVNEAWTNPLPRIDSIGDTETGIQKKVDEADPNYAKMNDKLDSIIIKKLDLNEATITEVVNLLIDKSRLYDKKYNEGVNIILSQSSSGSSSAPATEDIQDDMGDDADLDDLDMDIDAEGDFGDEEMTLGGDDTNLEEITVSLKFNDMPLRDVIQYVCDAANLQWRVDKFAVKIAKELPLDGKPVTKFFKVRASFIQAMLGAIGGGSSGGGDDEYDDYGDEPSGGGNTVTASSDDLKKAFTQYGVEFLKGTTISYNAHISKLAVKNSEENMVRIQEIINQFDTGRDLINIQSKFVEVSQNDISELGFEWMITDTREFGSGNGSIVIPGTVSDPNDITSGLSKLSDFLSEDQLAPGAGTVLESFITIGNTEFKNVIRALDKKQNADVLSSPEITTLSGEEAEIKSTITRYFPENWTEPEAGSGSTGNNNDDDDNGGGGTNSTPSIPEFGEPTELGVVLIVTPTSATGSKEIELTLAPSVKSFVAYDEEIKIPFPGSEPYSPKMAIIEERSLKTKVVCDDGETVVLGGLMKEKVTSYEDEVPGLSSIPFIGKLFKSEGEFSEKSNLLIFVTASIFDTAGRRRINVGSEGSTGDRGHALRK